MTPTVLLCLALSAAPPPLRLDADGIALPHHALARLGSRRFHHERPTAVVVSAEGSRSATYSPRTATVRIWDNRTGRALDEFALVAGDDGLLEFTADGGLVALDRGGKSLTVRDGRTGRVRRFGLGDGWYGKPVALRRDGAAAVYEGRGDIAVLSPRDGMVAARLSIPAFGLETPQPLALTFSPDGARLATYDDCRTLSL